MKTYSVVRVLGAALWILAYPSAHASAATVDAPISQAAYLQLLEATKATRATLLGYAALTGRLLDAYHVALAQGQLPNAEANTPLDGRLHTLLGDVAHAAQTTLPQSHLPPLARVYHLRTLAALHGLASVDTLGGLLAPSRALMDGLVHLQNGDRDLVAAQAAAAPKTPLIDPVWAGPLDEPVASIGHLVHLMAQPPAPVGVALQVAVEHDAQGAVYAHLRWHPPGVADGGTHRMALARSASCGQKPMPQDEPDQVATVDVQAGAFSEVLGPDAWQTPPCYHVTAVNPFGVHSHPKMYQGRLVGAHLAPPTCVTATALAPVYNDPNFYEQLDAVTVRWQPSVSETQRTSWDSALHQAAPQEVVGYAIYRLGPQDVAAYGAHQGGTEALPPQALRVGTTPFGVHQFTDRPALAELDQGVSYVVTALGSLGEVGRARGLPEPKATVHAALQPALALARMGAMCAGHPVGWEVQQAKALAQPEAQALAQAAFLARPASEQQALWLSFWHQAPVPTRQAFWREGTRLQSEAQRVAARRTLHLHLYTAGIQAAQLALYIEAHNEVLAAIEQHWLLLDEAGRRQAQKQDVLDAMPLAPRPTSVSQNGNGAAFVPVRQLLVERPEHVAAWWRSRDAAQVAAVASWWARFEPETQQAMLRGWLDAMADAVVDNLAWPFWEHLTQHEQAAWLAKPPQEVPAKLWPMFLAHVAFKDLPMEQRLAAVRHDVGPWQSTLTQCHYFLRPLDLWLDFQLTMAAVVLGLGILSGYLLRYASDSAQPPGV